jgi:hypothetical protein
MRTLAITLMITTLYAASPCKAPAALRSLGEGELAAVTGRAGISIDMDLGMRVTMGSFTISDTSATPISLVLNGITIDDGLGGNFLLKTSDAALNITPITYDVATDADGRTSLTIADSSRMNPRFYSVDSLVFAGQELGGVSIGPVTEGPSILRLSAPVVGSGIEFDYTTRVDIGAFRYAYNTSESLALSGIHLFGSATGAPEDPISWAMTGNFHIGEIPSEKPNPASIVIGAEQNGVPSTYVSLPMQGSLRVEDLSFGTTNFGPMAIDGLNVHRLQLKFTP